MTHRWRWSHWVRSAIAGMAFCCSAAAGLHAQTPTASQPATPSTPRLNLVLITVDDLQYDSLGVTGCKLPGITPHIDKLASEGLLFTQAHVSVAVCQPSRSVLMTGRYPVRNGALGFESIRPDVPTLGQSLRAAGYLNGIFAKVEHLTPQEQFCWDVAVDGRTLGAGRDPAAFYTQTKAFLERARAERRPFFLMANSQDPHRPFPGAGPLPPRAAGRQAQRQRPAQPVVDKYKPADVEVPGFLPDLPAVRNELARYNNAARRCDDAVGELLRAIDAAGYRDNTVIMFLSDNGMPFPFAKTNCYPFSTHTPWIVRWPGQVKPGSVDRQHFISGIDFMPTALELLGVKAVAGMDGRSFLPLLKGQDQTGRERIFTSFHQTSGRKDYPMRSVQEAHWCYIYNPWSDGQRIFQNEARNSPTFRAMEQAAADNPAIAARVKFFSLRCPEELYDVEQDPNCLHNLAADPRYVSELTRLRRLLLAEMQRVDDPLAKNFPGQ